TKLQAAKLATSSGTDVVICSGLEANILPRLVNGEQIGSYIFATNSKIESRKRWMLSKLTNTGFIYIDNGAQRAILNGSTSLLPAGITDIEGSFSRGDIVAIQDKNSTVIGAGICNYDAFELNKIKGNHSTQIHLILGHHYGDEVIHRDNMVVINDKDFAK
ncbi:uncharacterized protein METZ01_LOCUS431674, partial [marine metagenome]